MRSGLERWRPWLALAGVVLALVVLLPPVGAAVRQYVFVQAIQFAVLATVTPALVVVGRPWRLPGGRLLGGRLPGGRVPGAPVLGGRRLVDRVANARSHRPSVRFSWLALVVFLALVVAWRLPV